MEVDWGTLLIGWLVALAPIMAINALSQMKHGKETSEAESRYNRFALIWLVGFVPVLIMSNLDIGVEVGLGWTAACLFMASIYALYLARRFFRRA